MNDRKMGFLQKTTEVLQVTFFLNENPNKIIVLSNKKISFGLGCYINVTNLSSLICRSHLANHNSAMLRGLLRAENYRNTVHYANLFLAFTAAPGLASQSTHTTLIS